MMELQIHVFKTSFCFCKNKKLKVWVVCFLFMHECMKVDMLKNPIEGVRIDTYLKRSSYLVFKDEASYIAICRRTNARSKNTWALLSLEKVVLPDLFPLSVCVHSVYLHRESLEVDCVLWSSLVLFAPVESNLMKLVLMISRQRTPSNH